MGPSELSLWDTITRVVVKNRMAETGKRAKALKMQVSVRCVLVRISHGACCVQGCLFWVLTLVHLTKVESGVLKTVMWCRWSHSFVCHGTISLTQKDHLRLRGYLPPRDVQTVTLPSTLALSLKNQPLGWHETWIFYLYQLVQCKFQDYFNWRDLLRWQ